MARPTQNKVNDAADELTGQVLPGFNLTSTSGGNMTSADLEGHWTVLFLYPKDDTSGCTQESQDFSALSKEFEAIGVRLLGVSKDSLKMHHNFIKKYDLKLELLADEQTVLIGGLKAWVEKTLYGRKYMGTDRSTFVIGRDGKINHVWRKVKVPGHAQEVLNFLKSRPLE